MTKSEQYARQVVSGEILSCQWIKKAAERYLSDLERDDLVWDQEQVDKVMKFAEEIVHIPELRVKNEVQLPHAFWLEQIYGWKYKDGRRRFQSAYIQVARKNFKSFYAGIVSLIELLLFEDTYPEILHGANSRDQALICTGKTGEIVKKSPQLKKLWMKTAGKSNSGPLKMHTRLEETYKISFNNKNRRGKIEAVPRVLGDGGNVSMGVIDEFHEAKDSALLETIQSGQGQRLNPFTFVITSPGADKDGPCYQVLREMSKDALNGHVDRHLAIMFELDDESELKNLKMWEKSNPMVNYTPNLWNFLEERKKKAEMLKGSEAVNIYIKNAGLWMDQSNIWIPSEIIRSNNEEIDEKILEGQVCGAGVDLSAGGDLNAFVIIFPNIEGKVVVKSHFWIPEEKIKNQRFDGVDYQKWADDGHITIFEGNTVEYDEIAKYMTQELDKYVVEVVACDSKYLSSLSTFLKDSIYQEEMLAKVGQGFYLSQAINYMEHLLNKNRFNLMGNPILGWNLSNAEIRIGNHGDKMFVKSNAKKRIDGATALATGVLELLNRNFLVWDINIDNA